MKQTLGVVIICLLMPLGFMVGCQPNQVEDGGNSTPPHTPTVPVLGSEMATEPGVTAIVSPTPTDTPFPEATPTTILPTKILAGIVHIISDPEGVSASLINDQQNDDQTPVTWTLPPGMYTITLTLAGYENWIMPVVITAGSQMTLTATLHKQYPIIPIEENAGLFDAQWSEDGQTITYALADDQWPSHVQFLPVYQRWWQYNVTTGDKLALPSLQTRVTNAIRELLGVCPFPIPEIVPFPCDNTLQESPTSNRIVFSSGVNASSEANTWLASIDGSDVVYLDKIQGSPEDVEWSSDGRWLLIGRYYGASISSNMYYLVSSDGTFAKSLEELTGTLHGLVEGPTPHFSPDGQRVAFTGIETSGRQLTWEQQNQEDAYNLYVLDLNTLEYQLVSSRFGLFQWARDGNGLYILDGSANTADSVTTVSEVRYTDLYYIDLTQEPYLEERLTGAIPMYPRYTSVWAYSPETNAMAGEFDVHQSVFSIMLLE